MPKGQGHFGEQAGPGTSKNAKDKSNSATVRAFQDSTHKDQTGTADMRSRMSRYDSEKDSEKDSGFSEAGSDSVQNDLEDQRSRGSKHHGERSSSSSHNSSSGNANSCNMPTYKDLTFVRKSLVVKPVRYPSKNPSRPQPLLYSPIAWGEGWHSLNGAKVPTQVVLIQQPAIPTPSPAPAISSSVPNQQDQPQKGGSRNHKNHNSRSAYLPILNSYPRIAPYPKNDGHEEGVGGTGIDRGKQRGNEGQSQSKRVCTEEQKRETVSTTSHLLKSQQHHHQRAGSAHTQAQGKATNGNGSSPQNSNHFPTGNASSAAQLRSHHCNQNSPSESVGSPSISSSQSPSPPSCANSSSSSSSSSLATDSPYHPSLKAAAGNLSDSQSECSSVRQRRFLNTAEILSQSGLLAITLRTQELLKQNAATEREIAQLRQHTQLLCQVAEAGQQGLQQGYNDCANTLDKLHQAMTKSGSYPGLDLNQLSAFNSHPHKARRRAEARNEKRNKGANDKADDSPPKNLVPLSSVDNGMTPPSPLFAPSPEPERTEHVGGLPGSLLIPN